MSFQIYENASVQVINSGSVVMDPAGLFVASNWSGSTNIHPLSSSDDIYRNNGPIGENYYAILDGSNDRADFRGDVSPFVILSTGFDSNNTGSNAGLTHSWWMKTFSTSNHWVGGFAVSSIGSSTYYGGFGWYGGGGIIGNMSGVFFPADNDWHHYVFTYDSGSQKEYIYIDGDLKKTSAAFNVPVGYYPDQFGSINGAIDEWAYCHKFLSPSDLAPFGKPINLMKKKDEFRLKAYIKFGDGSEQGNGSLCHSLVEGSGGSSTGSFYCELTSGGYIGSGSADLLKNSGRVVDFNV